MEIYTQNQTKENIFIRVQKYLEENNFIISSSDQDRPWGGFFVIDETQADDFRQKFFPEIEKSPGKLSPKILLVAPGKKLSWQYHNRRAELWKLIFGQASAIKSDDDTEKDIFDLEINSTLILKNQERHRLIGREEWGIVAEIWQHADPENPSNEEDIIRLADDFGRQS